MRNFRLVKMFTLGLLLSACDNSGTSGPEPAADARLTAPPPPECVLVMGWDPWEPYQYEIAGGQVFGLDVDLVSAVLANADCQVAFRKGTWRELLQMLQEGEVDLLAGATRTADREEFAWFTEPYREEQFSLFVASSQLDELREQPFEQLLADGLRFGVVEDYLYGEPVTSSQDDPAYQQQFAYASMAETNFSRLLEGQVEGIIEDQFVGASVIRQKNLQDSIAMHPLALTSSPVSIMLSRASVDDELFNSINASVRQLRDNGAIDKILAQYLDL